ncbi:unnamed protein product [Chironomus riparius]|uniref:C-type lectin domain-containing protein n=1 Tax=Chironomus riparius TaxID=315576 RepID=A0A9N9RUD2_9DIPT|nr:unnamed protein product [Chironomus riparius]
MLKFILILISHILISFISPNPIMELSSLTPATSTTFDNIAFIKLGSYRGFNNDGIEYQKTYFFPRFSRPDWAGSRSFCSSYKMDLLTLETKSEEQSLLNFLDTNSYLRTVNSFSMFIDAISVA